MAVCPECEADIEMDEYDIDKGEIISCPECGIELEVLGLAPLELELAPQDEEEWQEGRPPWNRAAGRPRSSGFSGRWTPS
jgi:alpha-aminoadipate carrier protein LysW